MSAAEFAPFAAKLPAWASADGLLTPYCRDADALAEAPAASKTAEISHSADLRPNSTDVTDGTDAPIADWRDGVAFMLRLDRPRWAPIARWGRLRSALMTIRDEWAEDAFAAGWSLTDVFGCNPNPRAFRVDRDGLAVALAGHLAEITIQAVRPGSAVFADIRGSLMRLRLPIGAGAVPLWVAYSDENGP